MGNKARKVRWGQLLDGLDWYVYTDLVPCPNSVVHNNKHFLSHCFCESPIREQLRGLVLAQVLLWHCSHDISWGWCRLKARPGLEDLFPRWRTHVSGKLVPAIGGRPHSSPHGPTHKATWESYNTVSGFPPSQWSKKQHGSEATMSLMTQPWKSQPSFP